MCWKLKFIVEDEVIVSYKTGMVHTKCLSVLYRLVVNISRKYSHNIRILHFSEALTVEGVMGGPIG